MALRPRAPGLFSSERMNDCAQTVANFDQGKKKGSRRPGGRTGAVEASLSKRLFVGHVALTELAVTVVALTEARIAGLALGRTGAASVRVNRDGRGTVLARILRAVDREMIREVLIIRKRGAGAENEDDEGECFQHFHRVLSF
jgi:hypothetical protein